MPEAQDVAVVIDYENLYVSVNSFYEGQPNLGQIVESVSQYGRVATCQAFADWSQFSRSLPLLYQAGVQPVFCPATRVDARTPGSGKSSVDTSLCVHTMKLLHTCPNIRTLVLASGDRDFIPLVFEAKQSGRIVVVLSVARTMSSDLAEVADEVLLYEDIVRDMRSRSSRDESARQNRVGDPYPVLVEIVRLLRKEGRPTSLGYLKMRMRDRIAGFDETELKDAQGRKFRKFKDFILDAADRHLVKVNTTGTTTQILLPEEECPPMNERAGERRGEPPAPEARGAPVEPAAAPATDGDEDSAEGSDSAADDRTEEIFLRLLCETVRSHSAGTPLTYTHIVQRIASRKKDAELQLTNREIQDGVKECIQSGFLRGEKDGRVVSYTLRDDAPAEDGTPSA